MEELDHNALIATFVSESEHLLDEIEGALLQIESGDRSTGVRELLMRAAHTMKGNASCVSYDELTEYIHRFEDVLCDGELAPAAVTPLLRAVDEMRAAAASGGTLSATAADCLGRAESVVRGDAPRREEHSRDASTIFDGSDVRDARTIRVATSKLDRMIDLVGELAIARGGVAKLLADDGARALLVEAVSDTDRLHEQLQELVMSLRMIPIGPALQRFARTVRDLAAAHGKLAQLRIEGGDVEVDTAVVTALREPLTHMIRNAIDHGIEPPNVREQAGKRRVATVTLRARHIAGRIVVDVEDDGRGLDMARIVEQAKAAGVIAPAAAPDERAAAQLIFVHGFSTADASSDLSGRGVGMDVVRRGVEALRGTIEVASIAGGGTKFTISLPLTLAIIDGFALAVGHDTFIVPLDSVVECVDFADSNAARAEGLMEIRGEALPFVRLRHHLGMADSAPAARESVVVVSSPSGKVGLCSDRLIGQMQTVIKPLGLRERVPGVAAAAILGSGDVALILDVPQIVHSRLPHASPTAAA